MKLYVGVTDSDSSDSVSGIRIDFSVLASDKTLLINLW
jgi:hypothetical protein